MKKLLKTCFQVVLLFLLVFLGLDFYAFTQRAYNFAQSAVLRNDQDAVIALTGGRMRISAAVDLARAHALPLLISGVHEGVTPEDISDASQVDVDYLTCCTTLGYEARTTKGNGEEIAQWARDHDFSKLTIVTSNYHLERALLEITHSMPEADITGYAVESPAIKTKDWYSDGDSAKRLFLEWAKWRLVSIYYKFF